MARHHLLTAGTAHGHVAGYLSHRQADHPAAECDQQRVAIGFLGEQLIHQSGEMLKIFRALARRARATVQGLRERFA